MIGICPPKLIQEESAVPWGGIVLIEVARQVVCKDGNVETLLLQLQCSGKTDYTSTKDDNLALHSVGLPDKEELDPCGLSVTCLFRVLLRSI